VTPAAGVRAPAHEGGGDDRYFHADRPELRALVPPAARRVLDVGCGAGTFGAALKAERGIEVAGVELFAEAAAQAADRLDDVVVANLDDVRELPFAERSFDAMVFGDVLEHLRDPHRLLRMLRRYLADDGTLVCSIPNVKHWSVVFPLLVNDRWEYADAGLLDRTHVHFFTLEEAGRMFQETGFEVQSVHPTQEQPMPAALEPLVAQVARFGADVVETTARLNAYQYLIAARPLLT
jgi:methionine biosynthesis protein MetW